MSWSFTCPICDGDVGANIVTESDVLDGTSICAHCDCRSTFIYSSGHSWVNVPVTNSGRISVAGVFRELSIFESGVSYLAWRGFGELDGVWHSDVGDPDIRTQYVEEGFRLLRVMEVMTS